ncbi:hypothetical protein CSA37_01805 [Candidatus Fermentibacteria bacterium]|nr:MAG: hypothetical protein CSA37_01805 [Candidatus Fermentibacteria bacterium]
MSSNGYYWGIDVGGSFTKVGYLSGRNFILADSFRTGESATPEATLEKASEIILSRDSTPAAAGLGTAGLIDRENGTVQFSPNLPLWSGAQVRKILGDMLKAPVMLDNDCNVFATGAICSGQIPSHGLWLFLTLGTGIGGTIINSGEIIYGTGNSGEFGHTTVMADGIPCPCGSSGCWERYTGRKALEWYYRRITGSAISPLEIFALASRGDSAAREAYREFGRWFGIGLANLANSFSPHGFFIAGGLSAGLAHFGITARREFLKRCRHRWSLSLLEDSPLAGALGAASMVRERCS